LGCAGPLAPVWGVDYNTGGQGVEFIMNANAIAPVRVLPEEVANKIAAGEVVERPASVVKELIENSLDAGATRIEVRLVEAGRRTIEVVDNGHGMSEQDAHLAIERHATSKIRRAEDLDNIVTLGFRGEALASIAAVSRFELVTRRAKDDAAVRLRVEGGVLRDVTKVAGPVGTRIAVNRLYFNTPVRAKFLKGVTSELSQCIDVVQRHALAASGAAFRLLHNDKELLDVPANASLRDRVALMWGLNFASELTDLDDEAEGFCVTGLIGTPGLSRSTRSHQFFFLNGRPIVSRTLQYGFEDGYRELLTIGRRPVGIVLLDISPRMVDINIHPAKREVRFRDDRAVRAALQGMVRRRLAQLDDARRVQHLDLRVRPATGPHAAHPTDAGAEAEARGPVAPEEAVPVEIAAANPRSACQEPVQEDLVGDEAEPLEWGETAEATPPSLEPRAVYRAFERLEDAPLQIFDTYLLVPSDDRLLIIDQHALHERLTYDALCADLQEHEYESQQLAVPLLLDIPPSHTKLLDANIGLFRRLGFEIEPFGGTTYQVTGICHLYEESKVPDSIYRVLDALAQGDLFSRQDFMTNLLRLTVEACRGSVKAGDRLAPQERRGLLDGFRRLRPPYTCPHGRPIVTELTLAQMEKSFRRR